MYACELMWTRLVWAPPSTPYSFWVPSHRFNSTTGEQKGITRAIYTDSEPPSQLPNSLMPSAKLRSANLPLFTSLVSHALCGLVGTCNRTFGGGFRTIGLLSKQIDIDDNMDISVKPNHQVELLINVSNNRPRVT